MKIVCISDTHNCNAQIQVPEGDLLIHSGDATTTGTIEEIRLFNKWFSKLPHQYKIFVAGNHDWLFERQNALARSLLDTGIIYLQDSSVEIEGMRIYGSPWQPRFFDWAFNLSRGPELEKKWRLIPDDVEILITHGPPNGILDAVPRSWGIENTGCEELRNRVETLSAHGDLKIHVFGHIHCGYGVEEQFGIKFINASACDEAYLPDNKPIAIEI